VGSRRLAWLIALLLALAASAASAKPKIYILAVRESQSWLTNHIKLCERILYYLDKAAKDLGLSFDVEVVDSIEKWEKLMSEPPLNAVVINAHGELVPVPPKYGTNWPSFLRDLATNMVGRGWVFANPVGYGFYYATYNYTRRPDGEWNWALSTKEIEEGGLATLAASLGCEISVVGRGRQSGLWMTDLGKHVFGVLGYDMPNPANAPRPISTSAPVGWSFYSVKTGNVVAYSCVELNFGTGALLWGGWGQAPEDEQARVAVAMVLYHLFPNEIRAAQPKPPLFGGLRLEQLLAIGWGAVAAVLAAVLLKARRKS
jgi:hypothetical protein